MFENLVKQIKTENPMKETSYTYNVYEDNSLINPNIIPNKMKNIDSMTDREICEFIDYNYEQILDGVVNKGNFKNLELFIKSKFLTAMIQVMNTKYDLSYDSIINCNRIIYDYLVTPNRDKYITGLMLSLAKAVNKNNLPFLLGCNISPDVAAHLLVAKFSTNNDMLSIKRVNTVLINSFEELSEQLVVTIYEKMFDSLGTLFSGIMFDTNKEGLNSMMLENYSTISLAILAILEGVPSNVMIQILQAYTDDYYSLYYKTGYRFSMRSIAPEDYRRITQCMEWLEGQGVLVP